MVVPTSQPAHEGIGMDGLDRDSPPLSLAVMMGGGDD